MRPIRAVHSEDDIETTMTLFQQDGTTLCVVQDDGSPVGLITIEDILEQVVGQIGDEYPRHATASLKDAIAAGGGVCDLAARTPGQAITELAAAIPADQLPPQANIPELAMARELEVPTDLGIGVAIPHARCPQLREPIVVIGRSREGIAFSEPPAEPVRLIVLLVTPAERPDVQVLLLGQVARLAGDRAMRERMLNAASAAEILRIVGESGLAY